MDEFQDWASAKRLDAAVAALTKNGFEAFWVKSRDEARDKVLELIPAGASVGIGGSVTVRELGLVDALQSRGNPVYHHWQKFDTREQDLEVRHQEVTADVFLSSSNAVTLEGALVNIDATGNRVVGQIFGPSHTIIIAGRNKLVLDIPAALVRVKQVATPPNARRLGLKTPCALTGACNDCQTADRICRVTTIVERKPGRIRATVVLVDENLGY